MKKIERVGEYISEYSVRNKDNEDIQVYSVTNTNGFCTEYFDKDVASKDQTNYKIVPKGYFAYNPSRINVGSIDCQSVEDRVIVSPLYVVFKADERVDNNYLLHYLKSDIGKIYINELASGSVRANLKFSILQEFPFPMIPIEEQKEKMAVIAKIDESIACCDSIIEKLALAVKSRFVEMFGNPDVNENNWETYKMEQLCDVGSSKRIYQNEQSRIGIPFLRISDLVNRMDTGSKESDLYIPEDRFEELKKQGLVPKSGDILLTARGTLGRCYIIQDDDEFYFQDGMITWLSKYDAKITPLYISYLFKMPGFRKQIDSLQAGSTVAYLSISMTKKLDIMLPPIELQNQFADFVRAVDKSKLAVQEMKNKMEILKASVMQEYFC